MALHASELREFLSLSERAQPIWFLLACACQAGTYAAQAEVFRCVGRARRIRLPFFALCRLSVAKIFLDQALPSAGISGTVVLARSLEVRGISRAIVAAAIIVDLASYYAAYVLSLSLALAWLVIRHDVSVFVVLVGLVFIVFALSLSVALLAIAGRPAPRLPAVLKHFKPLDTVLTFLRQADPALVQNASILWKTSVLQLSIVAFDGATMWVLVRALGARASAGGVFASFVLSSLFRTIGVVPGGLGTFEATSVLTLKLVGVAIPVALSATLLFRGLSFWLPMLPGFWFSRPNKRKECAP